MRAEDHFDNDFLMHLLHDPDELQRSGRERHLAACDNCRDQLELYTRAQSFVRRESDFEVPADWVTRMVKIFEAKDWGKGSTTSPKKVFGWLLFDSLLADAPGVRTQTSVATERHLIWESAKYRVDLLIESANPDQAVITGQLVEKHPGEDCRLAGAIVEVMVGEDEDVFRGEVNSLGEFIVPVGRLPRGHPMEIQFSFGGVLSLVLLILS